MTINTQGSSSSIISFHEMTKPLPMSFSCRLFPFPESEKKEALKIIKAKFLSYPCAVSKMDEANEGFKLYHQEKEIQSLINYLGLDRYFNLLGISYTQAPTTISFCARNVIMILEEKGYNVFKQAMHDLMASARIFYDDRKGAVVALPDDHQMAASDIFSTLLTKHEGVCVGEYYHSNFTPKAKLISEMENLYDLGVRTIYLEHVFYDSMYQSLAVDKVIPPHVELYLQNLDFGHQVSSTRYNFLNLIRRAHQVGIRVVPIDTSVSYACGGHRKRGVKSEEERCTGMNFAATRIIEHEQKVVKGKYVALMGIAHLVEYFKGIPGVSELLGVPSLLMADGANEQLTVNKEVEDLLQPVSVFLESNMTSRRKLQKRREAHEKQDSVPLKRQKTRKS